MEQHIAPNSCPGGGTGNADTACLQFAVPRTSVSENMQRGPNIIALLAEAQSSPAFPPGSSVRSGNARRAAAYEESEEGSDDGTEAATFGNLKTSLVWDCTGRRLCLTARQYMETARKMEFKTRGMLDTMSGQHRIWGHVRKNFYTHVPLLQRLVTAQEQRRSGGYVDEPNLDPDAVLPGGLKCLLFKDWNISPGLSYDTARSPPLPPRQGSSVASAGDLGGAGAAAAGAGSYSGGRVGLPTLLQQRVRYTLAIQKNPQVIRQSEKMDVWCSARLLAEFEPKVTEVALGGALRLKAVKYGVTSEQDLRLSVGLDVAPDAAGRLVKMPYFHVSDGKLGARLQNRRWQLIYTL